MTAKPLPSLRVRSEYSFKQAFGPLKRVAEVLAEMKCPAAAIVDPGTWGHVKWAKELGKAGVAPLFGVELTVAQPDGRKPTAWALAEATAPFYQFSTAARRTGADVAQLFADATGTVRFAGAALTDPECFDYVDLNPASPLQQRAAIALAQRTGKPMVVTSDNAYPAPSDYAAFMAIIDRVKVTPQHLLTEPELRAAIPGLTDAQFKKAVKNTREIAERCAKVLPTAPLIQVAGDLRALAADGKARRIAKGHIVWSNVHEARLERELLAIEQKNFQSYFLVVSDLVRWAKERMLVGPGRGSSAGSLLCYLIDITEVDPLQHGLLFERFIDLTRKDLPDIDIDFNDAKRDDCFKYLADKYGNECVARIGNINTFKPRSVLAEVCKRFGIPDHERFNLVNVIIEYSSGDSRYGKGLEDTLNNTDVGKSFMERHPKAAVMGQVENHASHTGVHAAGVIVCNVPVADYCTVGADGVAQIDKPDAEALNLLKIDALGLSTLGIIEDAGVVTADELYSLKLDDPEVFRVFNEKRYSALFQFEGNSQRSISAQVHVADFKTVDHLTALSRPGPLGGGATGKYVERARGIFKEAEPHERYIEHILEDTFGVVLYQEQVMRIVREVGKFSWEETTTIRKAMSGRKGKEYFDLQGEKFIAGAAQDSIPVHEAKAIWEQICSFGAWGMNRCLLATTQIKLCHPNQFLGATPTIAALHDYYKVHPSAWIRQQKVMPVLLSLDEDGNAKPAMALDIIKTGAQRCWQFTFEDGRVVECTKEHKFIVDGAWQSIGNARIGSLITVVARDRSSNNERRITDAINRASEAFRRKMISSHCEGCGCKPTGRMEAHHNDFAKGALRPHDLAWLCNGCHKQRHIDNGTRRQPYARGHQLVAPAILKSVKSLGIQNTYDIEMPAPNHNYILANGVVTHNSHTCAYAMISYWCAWLKRYHPLEFAAACLRHAKDDEQTMAILREMADEGIEYVAFDIERSTENWHVADGRLIGGFMNLVGVGPAKASKAVLDRNAGRMTAAARAKLLDAKVKFSELYPLRKAYAGLYADPESHGCQEGSVVLTADKFPAEGPVLFLGRLAEKERRDENETVRVARRGRKLNGPTLFTDLVLRDDTGTPIICRIGRFDYEPLGRKAIERLIVGDDVLLVRGRRVPNFSMIRVDRLKCLTRPEILL